MDHVIQSDYALAFGLQLWFGFLVGPEELAEHGKSLLNKIDAFRTHIKDPMDRVHYDQHLSNQVLQFYDYFIKKVIYEEAWASWTEVDTFLDYECVMDLLLQRWPHVGVQIVHLLSYGNQRADIIANFLKTIGDTPEIIQQVEQLYRCLLQPSQISDYETLFFSYRDIISVLMARWPHRELALKLESHYKILGQKLVLAAQQGAINQVKKWLQEGADPSKCKVEGSSLMEFLVLHQPYKNSTERVNIIKIITLLLSHGADGNPTRGEGTTGLLIRLVNDPLYRHFVAARTPILLRLLDELKRRQGQENVVLRMRLQGALMGSAKPSSSLMS